MQGKTLLNLHMFVLLHVVFILKKIVDKFALFIFINCHNG
jgi:hypothetical protein